MISTKFTVSICVSIFCLLVFKRDEYTVSGFQTTTPTISPLTRSYTASTTVNRSIQQSFAAATTSAINTRRENARNSGKMTTTRLYAIGACPPTTATTAALSLLRGGVAKSATLDLGREAFYLQALASYGTVTALIMNALIDFHVVTKFTKKGEKNKNSKPSIWGNKKYLNTISNTSTALCLLCGTFTVILFNILGSYTRSALSMSNDEGYQAFRAATRVLSKWGFRCFLMSGGSFGVTFLLNLYSRITRDENQLYGKAVWGGIFILALLAGFNIYQVVGLATKYIYTPEALARLPVSK